MDSTITTSITAVVNNVFQIINLVLVSISLLLHILPKKKS